MTVETFVAALDFELADQELVDLIDCEIRLRADSDQSIDPFEYRNRFPDQVGAIESAFSRLKGSYVLITRTDDPFASENEAGERVGEKRLSDSIPERLGVFKIGKKLGSGAFGIVHLAEDTSTGQQLALKFPRRQRIKSPEELEMFRSEAAAATGLKHPGIVTNYGLFDVDGFLFIAQQYVSGGSLTSLRESDVSQRRVAEIIASISEALAYAHLQGITHRDLKPSNVMLDKDANPLITDFGLAVHESAQRRLKGQRCGTPPYMSPEQVNGLAHILDGRSDIWSVGVIMYELLVGRRPFEGSYRDELYEEITERDPKPPRMIRPQVDRELQRICLKCLFKPIRERYHTADELTQDLRCWLEGRFAESVKRKSIHVVPQGLRSFGAHDSDFYQRLLPGPKDQRGLAESTRFWKSQIETSEHQAGFRVGVIIGPSGCGKSSYIKAGLLPFLDARRVDSIFVEATSEDTETRLAQQLRARFPELPAKVGLPRLVDLIREELRKVGGRKLLIVIDQIEQWLHAQQAFEKTELLQALLHVDGINLQCVLLVRDDFWLRISQFLHAMEIDFREGTNARRVDLFGRQHARQVLHEFGLAFGKLPDLDHELQPDQAEFLEQAIESIADEERVVCVRLALFAEMFRNRPWTVAELKKVGGADGIGETFLNETFSSPDADPFYRRNEQPVRRILAGLLPTAGDTIRAHMRTYDDLLSQSLLPSHEFDELMGRLDNELRLVTPTDPNASGEDQKVERCDKARHFQLTHDYLVPSIRDWLTKEKKRTKFGRAELRLNELSEYWNQKQDPNFLPSWSEYASIRWRVNPGMWNEQQRRFMRKASQIFLFRGALVLLAVSLVGALGYVLNYRVQANALHDELLSSNISHVPDIIEKMQPIRGWVEPLLVRTQEGIEDRVVGHPETMLSDGEQRRLLRLNLVRVGLADGDVDSRSVAYLKKQLLEARPEQFEVIRQTLLPCRDRVIDDLWQEVENQNGQVLQAGAALVLFDPDNSRWSGSLGEVANRLVNVPTVDFPIWMSIFEPAREKLLPALTVIYADPNRSSTAKRLALELVLQYQQDETHYLIDAVGAADPEGFQAIIPELSQKSEALGMLEEALNVVTLPDWNDEASRLKPDPPSALRRKFASSRGILKPEFAFCVSMPRVDFHETCAELKPLGYRPGSIRVSSLDSGVEHFSCVWIRDGLEFEQKCGTAEEIRLHHQVLEADQYQAIDVARIPKDRLAAKSKEKQPVRPARYCVTWCKSNDGSTTHLQLELTSEQWVEVSSSIALTGYKRNVRRCVARHPDGTDRLSGIWSKAESPSLTFDRLNPQDESFVGQLQLDLRPDDSEVWTESLTRESASICRWDPERHLDEAEQLISRGFRPDLVVSETDEQGNLSVSSVWHRPIITDAEKEIVSRKRTRLIMALLELDPESPVAWKEFQSSPDPRTRSDLIHRLPEFGIERDFLFHRLQSEKDVSARRALLLALGEYDPKEIEPAEWSAVSDYVVNEFKTNVDAGIHGASEWLLKKWGLQDDWERATESLQCSKSELLAIRADDQRRWYVSPLNHQMVLITGGRFLMGSPPSDVEIGEDEVLQWKKIDRTFALAEHEMTREQYNKFIQATAPFENRRVWDMVNRQELHFQAPTMDCPVAGMDWYEAAAYCNWLSEQEGIPEDQWCYETNEDDKYGPGMKAKPGFLSLSGYRLPTVAEWEFACRSGALTPRYYGQSAELLEKYCWYAGNSNRRTWSVGSLKPNDFGLFDMHGNLWEWCQDTTINYGKFLDDEEDIGVIVNGSPGRSLRGGYFEDAAYGVRAADRSGMEADARDPSSTFRICRTIPQ